MSDWRKSPRRGKSSFMPFLQEIKERLARGETKRMIFDNYADALSISYTQFTRYVKTYCEEKKGNDSIEKTKEINRKVESVEKIRISNPADLKAFRSKIINLEELTGDSDESRNP